MSISVYWNMWDSACVVRVEMWNRFSVRGKLHFGQESLWCNETESGRASFKPAILVGTEHWFDLNFWKWYCQFSYESHFPYLHCISFSLTHNNYFFNFFMPLFIAHIFKTTLHNFFLISVIDIGRQWSQRWIWFLKNIWHLIGMLQTISMQNDIIMDPRFRMWAKISCNISI